MNRELFKKISLCIVFIMGIIIPQCSIFLLLKRLDYLSLLGNIIPIIIAILVQELVLRKTKNETIFIPAIIGMFIFCIGVIYFFYFHLIFEVTMNSPSSTSGLTVVFIPFYAIFASLVGFLGGIVIGTVNFFIRKIKVVKTTSNIIAFLFFLFLVCLLMIYASFSLVNRHSKLNKPRVILDKNVISRLTGDNIKLIADVEEELWNYEEETSQLIKGQYAPAQTKYQLIWNATTITILFDEHYMHIFGLNDKIDIFEDFKTYDYIRRIVPTTIKSVDNGEEYLIIVAILRATSFRSVICIYNSGGELIYQEILEYVSKIRKGKFFNSEEEILILEDKNGRISEYKVQ